MNPALASAREAFSWAKAKVPKDCELEIYLSQGRGRSVVWSEGKCEDMAQADGGGVGVRVILREGGSGGRQGFAYTTLINREAVEKAAERAVDAARMLPVDEFRALPPASAPSPEAQKDLFDESAFSEAIPQIQERLRAQEGRLLKSHPVLKSVLRAAYSEGASDVAIVNQRGVEHAFSGTHVGLGVSCLAEKDGERQEGGFGQSRRYRKDLDWDFVADQGALRTLALLGGRAIPSGKIPVVFDPSVGSDFLSLVSGAVCADSVQKGKSFLAGKIGTGVASPLVSLVDDGTLNKGLATSPVDDEGVPTQRTEVVSQGKLRHYLYDTYTALKGKTRSTGNAGRAGFKSSPASGPTNFFLQPGKQSRDTLLKQTRGLYLYDVMGLHMADPISGDFSVGVMGAWLENGEFKYGVRGVTLAGNLLDLLGGIDAVADDLMFFGSLGCPTFRVRELVISGN